MTDKRFTSWCRYHTEVQEYLVCILRGRQSRCIQQLFVAFPRDVYEQYVQPFLHDDVELSAAFAEAPAETEVVVVRFGDNGEQDTYPFCLGTSWATIRADLATSRGVDPSRIQILTDSGDQVNDLGQAVGGTSIEVSFTDQDWQDIVNRWPDCQLKSFVIEKSRKWSDEPEFPCIIKAVDQLISLAEPRRGSSPASDDSLYKEILEVLNSGTSAKDVLNKLENEFGCYVELGCSEERPNGCKHC